MHSVMSPSTPPTVPPIMAAVSRLCWDETTVTVAIDVEVVVVFVTELGVVDIDAEELAQWGVEVILLQPVNTLSRSLSA